jgi:hypothetical protein
MSDLGRTAIGPAPRCENRRAARQKTRRAARKKTRRRQGCQRRVNSDSIACRVRSPRYWTSFIGRASAIALKTSIKPST